MPDRLAKALRRRSLNQLLLLHLASATPLAVCAFLFHGFWAIAAYMYIPLGWGVWSHLRRNAWKQQFRPRTTKAQA